MKSSDAVVYTFYSYKGGVGRSFALANCAALLARWGFRVVCLDWDLEAPGLQCYFPGLNSAEPGIVDWILDRGDNDLPTIQQAGLESTDDRLSIVSAGRDCGCRKYLARFHSIDWETQYREAGLGARLERLRETLIDRFDFVLIDSRTGISDIGGICGIHLPDVVVAVLTANNQNISGTVEVTARMIANRADLVYERSALKIVPVLSRFDAREEYTLSEDWRRRVGEGVKDLYSCWLDKAADPHAMLGFTTIPYVTRWTFGEEIAVQHETQPSPDHISYSLESLAALIANRLQDNLMAIRNRSSYVSSAKGKGARSSDSGGRRFIFLSASRSQCDFSRQLAKALEAKGVRIRSSTDAIQHGEGNIEALNSELSKSDSVVILMDGGFSPWQTKELELAVEKVFGERSGQSLLPIKLGEVDESSIPPFLHNIAWIDARGQSVTSIAETIFGRVERSPRIT